MTKHTKDINTYNKCKTELQYYLFKNFGGHKIKEGCPNFDSVSEHGSTLEKILKP